MEIEMSGERVRRLGQKLSPEHGATIPGRISIDLNLDPLFLGRRCGKRDVNQGGVSAFRGTRLSGVTYWQGSCIDCQASATKTLSRPR